jgi:hypothetical protein
VIEVSLADLQNVRHPGGWLAAAVAGWEHLLGRLLVGLAGTSNRQPAGSCGVRQAAVAWQATT